jgi:hypothetical protein
LVRRPTDETDLIKTDDGHVVQRQHFLDLERSGRSADVNADWLAGVAHAGKVADIWTLEATSFLETVSVRPG